MLCEPGWQHSSAQASSSERLLKMSWVAVSTPRLAFWRACAPCRYFASARPPYASPVGALRRLPGLARGPPAAPRSVLSRRVHEAATRARQGASVPAGIELIVGPMFSGKTTALLRRVEELERAGLSVALVKSSKDDRYSQEHVVTHNGLSRVGWGFLRCFVHKVFNKFMGWIATTLQSWHADCPFTFLLLYHTTALLCGEITRGSARGIARRVALRPSHCS